MCSGYLARLFQRGYANRTQRSIGSLRLSTGGSHLILQHLSLLFKSEQTCALLLRLRAQRGQLLHAFDLKLLKLLDYAFLRTHVFLCFSQVRSNSTQLLVPQPCGLKVRLQRAFFLDELSL